MKPKFDLYVRTRVIRAEKTTKPLTALPAANQHQMNRIRGFVGGKEVLVAQRPGKGGMDFNKITAGKVYAVAADGFSPVMEKDDKGVHTKTQRIEEGLPYFSSSGFYMLSSPEYPALDILECFTRLHRDGELVLLMSLENLKGRAKATLGTPEELDTLLSVSATNMLADEHNLVRPFDAKINKKRKLNIDQAKLALASADDEDEDSSGTDEANEAPIAYTELTVSPKDGNAFLYLVAAIEGQPAKELFIIREKLTDGEKSQFMAPCSADEAIEEFKLGEAYSQMHQALSRGLKVELSTARGAAMRPSPMFSGKIEAVKTNPPEKNRYGDPVYIQGALRAWTPGIASILHSKHPAFPKKDYDHNYYVVAVRQGEIGMNKDASGKYLPPEAVCYDFVSAMLA